jgi:hypothetical protein
MTLAFVEARRKQRSIGAISRAWEAGLVLGRARQAPWPPKEIAPGVRVWFLRGHRHGRRQAPRLIQGDLFSEGNGGEDRAGASAPRDEAAHG